MYHLLFKYSVTSVMKPFEQIVRVLRTRFNLCVYEVYLYARVPQKSVLLTVRRIHFLLMLQNTESYFINKNVRSLQK